MMRYALAFCVVAGPAAAEDLPFTFDNTEFCLQEAVGEGERLACIGASAEQCMETYIYGGSTRGQTECISAEWKAWDARLNASYGVAREQWKNFDREMDVGRDTLPKTAAALLTMQRAWIAYRDATCDFELAQWQGGTGGNPAYSACMMRLTALQTLYLEGQW